MKILKNALIFKKIDDFRSYLQTKNGEAMAKRYGFSSKLYVQVILDKYKGFI